MALTKLVDANSDVDSCVDFETKSFMMLPCKISIAVDS